nr:hypothetical protein CFP56_03370 [Quercus suber]
MCYKKTNRAVCDRSSTYHFPAPPKSIDIHTNSLLYPATHYSNIVSPVRQQKTYTMAAFPVVLILGAGPRVGAAAAHQFASDGYKVAIAARKGTNTTTSEGFLSLQADFNKPDSVPAVFETVKAELGVFPSVVIYNAAAFTPPSDKESALSITSAGVSSDLNVNVVSPFVAAQEAVKGWATLATGINKAFIFTGNIQNEVIIPSPAILSLGMGKAASAYWLGLADGAYSTHGYRFIYADERHPDGTLKGGSIDGSAHASFYSQLAKSTAGVPWHATFVKDKGYVSFK